MAKQPKEKTTKALINAHNFENTIENNNRRLSRLGWSMAGLFGASTLALSIAINFMLPLQRTTVELYAMDKQSGVVQKITTVDSSSLNEELALMEHDTASYVELREGYNFLSLQHDYDRVQILNSKDVNAVYLKEWDDNNPEQSPDQRWNSTHLVTITILSNSIEGNLANIRYARTIKNIVTGQETHDYWALRMTFTYEPKREMKQAERVANPFGFTVTSYHRVPERVVGGGNA